MKERTDAVVVGLGQWAAGDDSVGLFVAQHVAAQGIPAIESADATVLLELLAVGRRVVLVDAVLSGAIAGRVLHLKPSDLDGGRTLVSSHGIGIVDTLALVTLLHGADVLRDLAIVGVTVGAEPRVGSRISPPVRAAISPAAALATRLALRASTS